MGPIWQAQLGESLVMLIGPSWAHKFTALLQGRATCSRTAACGRGKENWRPWTRILI